MLLLHHFRSRDEAAGALVSNERGIRTCGSGEGAARRATRARASEGEKKARLAGAARRANGVAAAEARRVAADAARRSAMAGLLGGAASAALGGRRGCGLRACQRSGRFDSIPLPLYLRFEAFRGFGAPSVLLLSLTAARACAALRSLGWLVPWCWRSWSRGGSVTCGALVVFGRWSLVSLFGGGAANERHAPRAGLDSGSLVFL